MLGVGHYPRWLQKQTPVRVFAHHKALVGAAGQDCAAAVIGFYDCDFGHYITNPCGGRAWRLAGLLFAVSQYTARAGPARRRCRTRRWSRTTGRPSTRELLEGLSSRRRCGPWSRRFRDPGHTCRNSPFSHNGHDGPRLDQAATSAHICVELGEVLALAPGICAPRIPTSRFSTPSCGFG